MLEIKYLLEKIEDESFIEEISSFLENLEKYEEKEQIEIIKNLKNIIQEKGVENG